MTIFNIAEKPVRSLKNSLRDQLPSFKSTHLSESLAYALGFRTQVALKTQLAASPGGWAGTLDESRFFARLATLSGAEVPPFSISGLIPTTVIPPYFARYLAEISALQERLGLESRSAYRVREKCASAFAHYFNLGRPSSIKDDPRMVLRHGRGGVDHSATRAGWGALLKSMGPLTRFPGLDHTVYFYEKLPLSGGRYIEYNTGLVSMPYIASTHNMGLIPKAAAIAETLGWESIALPQWTWYVPFSKIPNEHATTLMLLRRKESREDTLRAWATSFKRWAIENEPRIDLDAYPNQEAALTEIFESSHFPLNVTSFNELRVGYLNEFAQTAYQWKEGALLQGMEELFTRWLSER